MDGVGSEDVSRRAIIVMKLASRVDLRVLRCCGHVLRMNEYCTVRRVLMAEVTVWRYRVDLG